MAAATPTTILARDFSDPQTAPMQWGVLLAERVGPTIQSGTQVVISFAGTRGVASSYFNVLLLKLLEFVSRDELLRRVSFQTDSVAQKQILDRSVQAVLVESKNEKP